MHIKMLENIIEDLGNKLSKGSELIENVCNKKNIFMRNIQINITYLKGLSKSGSFLKINMKRNMNRRYEYEIYVYSQIYKR